MELSIPSQIKHSLFFEKEKVNIDVDEELSSENRYLLFEILYYHSIHTKQPWLTPKDHIPIIIELWKGKEQKLKTLFKKRSKETKLKMINSITICFLLIFWMNGEPVHLASWKEKIKGYQHKTVNLEERLEFILSNASSYLAFVQLSEIINEQNKLWVKYNAMNEWKRKKEAD
ncbi:hypothetical protein J6TS2_20850 [Heyndrickxia sporothermodurans]|nr:hypothetical protein J6TS2_20850 [Heyndrickxia sporothermodurans]